jgi:hypothetical protein
MAEKKYTQADLDKAVAEEKAARRAAEADAANARAALQQLQVCWLRNAIEQAMWDTKIYHASVLTGRCVH